MLTNKTAVIYGAGGAIGGAVARAFARDGARVFLTGRTLAKVQAVANDISATGTSVDAAQVDALNEEAIENHLDAVVKMTGQIDISFNRVHGFGSGERDDRDGSQAQLRITGRLDLRFLAWRK